MKERSELAVLASDSEGDEEGSPFSVAQRVETAAQRLEGSIVETPVVAEASLERDGVIPLLKLESRQLTGSFKLRGAMHRLLCLSAEQRRRGVVTASSGNHALAVAHGLARLGIPGAIYLPETVSPAKLARLQRSGAELVLVPGDPLRGELAARRRAAQEDRAYISPYNDLDVVAGQGTVAVELLKREPDLDTVYVTVGGGGLIGGMGAWLKRFRPELRLIGCSPAQSAVMSESVREGRIVERPNLPTLSDGSAGGLEEGTVTFELCRRVVDEWIEVEEDAIASAMAGLIRARREAVEGAAGVAVAAWRRSHRAGERAAIVICGGNVSLSVLKRVLRSC